MESCISSSPGTLTGGRGRLKRITSGLCKWTIFIGCKKKEKDMLADGKDNKSSSNDLFTVITSF